MRKKIALFLALVFLVTTFAGCGGSAPSVQQPTSGTNNSSSGPANGPNNEEKPPKYRIGAILYGNQDSLGSIVYSNLNYAAEILGVEIVWAMGNLDPTAQIVDAENLIASGVDGIWMLPIGDAAAQKVADLCEQNNIFLALSFKDSQINTDGYKYYLGTGIGDDKGNAKELAHIMAESGAKKVACYYAFEGTSAARRNDGFNEGIAEYGLENVAQATIPSDTNVNTVYTTIQNFLNTNPDIDGIFTANASSGMGEAMIRAITEMKSDAKLACFDVFEGVEDAFKNGSLAASCGGHTPQSLLMFMTLYNAIDGYRFSEEPIKIYQRFIFLTDIKDIDVYEKYIINPDYQIYEEEDIKNMAYRYNPEVDLDYMNELMENYSLENVKAEAESRK